MANRVGGRRPGAGRKPKPLSEKQAHRVALAFTTHEHAALVRAAGAEPVASWIRALVLRALSRRGGRRS